MFYSILYLKLEYEKIRKLKYNFIQIIEISWADKKLETLETAPAHAPCILPVSIWPPSHEEQMPNS